VTASVSRFSVCDRRDLAIGDHVDYHLALIANSVLSRQLGNE
jgi:hypothetical protein